MMLPPREAVFLTGISAYRRSIRKKDLRSDLGVETHKKFSTVS